MIYSRFGSPVTVVAYCGRHQPKWSSVSLSLLKVRYDDGAEGYVYSHTLKATGGPTEVDQAVDTAPEMTLSLADLKAALRAAE